MEFNDNNYARENMKIFILQQDNKLLPYISFYQIHPNHMPGVIGSVTKTWLNKLFSYFHLGASTLVVALHASFYNIDAIVTEEFDVFLTESETV